MCEACEGVIESHLQQSSSSLPSEQSLKPSHLSEEKVVHAPLSHSNVKHCPASKKKVCVCVNLTVFQSRRREKELARNSPLTSKTCVQVARTENSTIAAIPLSISRSREHSLIQQVAQVTVIQASFHLATCYNSCVLIS